jgi:hypothetical protein
MLTWNELSAIGLIKCLGDPELVLYLMSILKPIRRDLIEEEARTFHKSLRITKEERWIRLSELKDKKNFREMNPSVPITCKLPFDGRMWRNSISLLKTIRYFRENFMNKEIVKDLGTYYNIEQITSEKIQTVNSFLDTSLKGCEFRDRFSILDIDEARCDFEIFSEDMEPDYPYLLRCERNGLPFISIIN